MSEMNELPNDPAEVPPEPRADAMTQLPVHQAPPPGLDIKRRMRELLSIPDSQRSDAQWDELIELEIQLAPGNRVGTTAPRQNDSRPQHAKGGSGGGAGGGAGGNWKRHPQRKHPKPGPKKPMSGPTGGAAG